MEGGVCVCFNGHCLLPVISFKYLKSGFLRRKKPQTPVKEKLSKHDISTPSNLVHVSGIKASASGFEMINNSSQVDPKIAGNSMYNIFLKQLFMLCISTSKQVLRTPFAGQNQRTLVWLCCHTLLALFNVPTLIGGNLWCEVILPKTRGSLNYWILLGCGSSIKITAFSNSAKNQTLVLVLDWWKIFNLNLWIGF